MKRILDFRMSSVLLPILYPPHKSGWLFELFGVYAPILNRIKVLPLIWLVIFGKTSETEVPCQTWIKDRTISTRQPLKPVPHVRQGLLSYLKNKMRVCRNFPFHMRIACRKFSMFVIVWKSHSLVLSAAPRDNLRQEYG